MTRLAALLLLLPGLAAAQPRLVPAGNVDVLYRLAGAAAGQIPGGAPDGVRLQWDAAGQRLRADVVNRQIYAITDLPRRLEQIVFAPQASLLELPLRGGDPQSLLAGADVRFTRRGAGRVLGLDCTEWQVQSRSLAGTGCVTPDGVVLRTEGSFGGRQGSATAVSVSREPIPPERFVPPPGLFRLKLGAR